ncbi:MAG: hypothetical protein U1E78_00060 [Gammaproteobacteria bacterium]
MDESENGNPKINDFGVAAHIYAASPTGPRPSSSANLTQEDIKSFANGIWVCNNCSRIIDNNEYLYTADKLKAMKAIREFANKLYANDADIRAYLQFIPFKKLDESVAKFSPNLESNLDKIKTYMQSIVFSSLIERPENNSKIALKKRVLSTDIFKEIIATQQLEQNVPLVSIGKFSIELRKAAEHYLSKYGKSLAATMDKNLIFPVDTVILFAAIDPCTGLMSEDLLSIKWFPAVGFKGGLYYEYRVPKSSFCNIEISFEKQSSAVQYLVTIKVTDKVLIPRPYNPSLGWRDWELERYACYLSVLDKIKLGWQPVVFICDCIDEHPLEYREAIKQTGCNPIAVDLILNRENIDFSISIAQKIIQVCEICRKYNYTIEFNSLLFDEELTISAISTAFSEVYQHTKIGNGSISCSKKILLEKYPDGVVLKRRRNNVFFHMVRTNDHFC